MRPNIGPFPLGINNRRAETDLSIRVERATIDLLKGAVNVDVVDDGTLRRRAGTTQLSPESMHSLWGDGGPVGYAVRGTELLALDARGGVRVVQGGMVPNRPVSFTRLNGVVFYSDGLRMGAVRDAQVLPLTPVLSQEPQAQARGEGSLDAGRYQLVFTVFGPMGESAATEPVVVEVADSQQGQGSIYLSGLPLVPPGMELRCYMTGPNGSMFHRAEMAEFGGAALITTQADTGALAETMGLMPLPAGQILRAHKSRMLCARGHVLFYSQAFAPLLADPVSGYVAFDAPITMVRPCGQGVYVAAGRTYWFAGDLSIADMQEVLPYDALPGSDSCHPKNPETVFWMSEHGLVRANSAGQVQNVQEENLAIEGGQRAATYLRERGGQRHVIAATQSPGIARGAVHASMDAEIVRY